jgi:signal transduction histidine kinase
MEISATNEAVRRAMARTRWLHGVLILLVLVLGLISLQAGRRLEQVRAELAKSRWHQWIEESRTLRERGEPGWFQSARERLGQARLIRSDHVLRQAWLDCLLQYPARREEPAVPYRVLIFPAGLQRGPLRFNFSADGLRLIAQIDARNVVWNLGEPQRPPRLSAGMERVLEPPVVGRVAGSRLQARVTETGKLEIQDNVSNALVIELRGRSQLQVETVAWSADGTWIADSGWIAGASGPQQRVIELWHIPALRAGLALLDLDWADADPSVPPKTPRDPGSWLRPFRLALGSFLVLAVTSAVITHQHLVYRRYLEAQKAAAAQAEALEQARERVAHADKMRALGTLAAGVAHDFNNLLSVIQMSRQLVERSLPVTAPAREHLTNIAQAVDQGRSVVRSILGYSRDGRPGGAPNRIAEIVDETLNLLRRQFLGGIELEARVSKDLVLQGISRGRLEQILLNLLVNASEAMGGRGRLSLCAEVVETVPSFTITPARPGPWIELRIGDSGPGISSDILPRIFEPFFTTKNLGNQRGTGLGLATVWRIVTEEGLGLGVHTAPGLGTEFLLYLPVSATGAGPSSSEKSSETQPPPSPASPVQPKPPTP